MTAALLATLAWAVAPAAEAQAPIRIGATLSQTGAYATSGQNQLRGYQLCVKRMNEKGGVLRRKLELVVYDDASDPAPAVRLYERLITAQIGHTYVVFQWQDGKKAIVWPEELAPGQARFPTPPSDPATAVRLYEKLITRDKVDLVLGPFSGFIADPVADVTEKHKMPMMAPVAAVTSIYRKGRTFIFSMMSPAEVLLEGLIDLAAKKGLKTVALINADDSAGPVIRQSTFELAKRKGLQVVFADAYPEGTTDFSAILTRVQREGGRPSFR